MRTSFRIFDSFMCLPNALTICLCCSMLSFLSTRDIAFVIDFSVQYYLIYSPHTLRAAPLSFAFIICLSHCLFDASILISDIHDFVGLCLHVNKMSELAAAGVSREH